MKKLFISFSLMLTLVLSTVSVFAATYTNVEDSQRYNQTLSDYGIAYLRGKRNDLTDRLSNVTTSKKEVGKVTVSITMTQPTQFSAKADAVFKYNGTKKLQHIYLFN